LYFLLLQLSSLVSNSGDFPEMTVRKKQTKAPRARSAPAKSVLTANYSRPQSRNSCKKRTKEEYEENLCDFQLCRKVKQ